MNIAARVQGLADVDEICLTEAVMASPGVGEAVTAGTMSSDYVPLRGIGQKVEVHRIRITPTGS